jgi:hypothetical protein
VHDYWKRSKRNKPMEKRSFLNKQRKKFDWWFYIWTSFQPSLLLWCYDCFAYFQLPTRSKFYKCFFVLKSNRKKHKHFHVENVWNYVWKHLLNCECRSFGICMAQLVVIKNSFTSKMCNNNVAWRQFSHAMCHCKKDGHSKFDMLSISSL